MIPGYQASCASVTMKNLKLTLKWRSIIGRLWEGLSSQNFYLNIAHCRFKIILWQLYIFSCGSFQLPNSTNYDGLLLSLRILSLKCKDSYLWVHNNLEFPLFKCECIHIDCHPMECNVLRLAQKYLRFGGACCLHVQVIARCLLWLGWRGIQSASPKHSSPVLVFRM